MVVGCQVLRDMFYRLRISKAFHSFALRVIPLEFWNVIPTFLLGRWFCRFDYGRKRPYNHFQVKIVADIDLHKITVFLRTQLPNLLAAYHFGSRATGTADSHSDVDLAVLIDGKIDTVALWNLAQQLADEINCDVDLIDLRTASTVMQYQIIVTGQCLWARNVQAAIYESFILSEKTALDTLRKDLIVDIEQKGRVYGR